MMPANSRRDPAPSRRAAGNPGASALHGRTSVPAAARAVASTIRIPALEGWSRLAWHVIAPGVTVLTLIAFFFSGSPTLSAIVAPAVNRELGLLEHLQVGLLVAIGVLGAAAWRRERMPLWKWFFLAMTAGAAFLVLEEVNYGQHYLALLTGVGSEQEVGPRSLHNIGATTDWLKLGGDIAIAALFVVVPLLRQLTGRAFLGPLTPGPWYVATVALMVLVSQVPHMLDGLASDPGSLRHNLSEFRELMLYHLGALFAWDVVNARRFAMAPGLTKGRRGAVAVPRAWAAIASTRPVAQIVRTRGRAVEGTTPRAAARPLSADALSRHFRARRRDGTSTADNHEVHENP